MLVKAIYNQVHLRIFNGDSSIPIEISSYPFIVGAKIRVHNFTAIKDLNSIEFTTIVILSKDNPNIENLLTILGTNINAGNVEFDATVNPSEDIQIIIGKDYQEFLNLNQ